MWRCCIYIYAMNSLKSLSICLCLHPFRSLPFVDPLGINLCPHRRLFLVRHIWSINILKSTGERYEFVTASQNIMPVSLRLLVRGEASGCTAVLLWDAVSGMRSKQQIVFLCSFHLPFFNHFTRVKITWTFIRANIVTTWKYLIKEIRSSYDR